MKPQQCGLARREFLLTTAGGCAVLAADGGVLEHPELTGGLRRESGATPIEGAAWYVAEQEDAAMVFHFAAGALATMKYLTTDMLLEGDTAAYWGIALQEGEKGRTFRFAFGGLNQCSFRVRMALSLVDQNRWQSEREGAFLKPLSSGDRVDLARVDRLVFSLKRKGPKPVRWAMTPLLAAAGEVPKLSAPKLPKGPLLDEFGQFRLKQWPGKTANLAELTARIRAQHASASNQSWPEMFSNWGGWKLRKLGEGTGYFRTHHDGKRWWLVDPEGYAFWSAGVDCVRVDTDARYDGIEAALAWIPPANGEFADIFRGGGRRGGVQSINYLAANIIRSLGAAGWRDKWAAIALAEMKRLRFNTVGNWSEFEFARKARFPYVRPLSFNGGSCGMIYRDFPDVFHPAFESDAGAYASALASTAGDPALIGYFLMNEPTWGFSSELPAAGMLYTSDGNHTRTALAAALRRKYDGDAALAQAWKMPVSFDAVARGRWTSAVLTPEAKADLREFSVTLVERYFRVLSEACRKVDPHHLNLGMRWAGVPPSWAVEGMKFFDVFSINCYMEKLPRDRAEAIHSLLKRPVLVGEWHFGALDVGLPASGIGHLKNQEERAKAYRVYLEDAAADPYCVGVHWFTLYDQSALGRFDGENYNIGFLDVCNRPYDAMCSGAIASHERMYEVAAGRAAPFDTKLDYLPKLFL